jgi:hypothetical protein
MNHDERDERLGAALRRLPVPDHAPGFWDDLAGRLAGDDPGPVVRLDEERRARRRRLVPVGAAAVVAALLGAGLMLGDGDDSGRQVVADRPAGPEGAGTAMITVSYTARYASEPDAGGTFELTVADDGSFRWTDRDGLVDVAYDAAAGRVVEQGLAGDRGKTFVATDLPPDGPDLGVRVADPLGPLADFVVSLARAGDPRVTEATHAATGRGVWRYDGPVAEDRLSGGDSPNHALAEVDRETGVLLTLRSDRDGRPYQELAATRVETAGTVDRSRFSIDVDPSTTDSNSAGFKPVSPEEASAAVPYPVLVPEEVPAGFRLDAVAVNREVPSITGAEGMNPPVTDVVVMRWRKGFLSFALTLRPGGGQAWDDPFGAEGKVFRRIPVRAELPGLSPLAGTLVVDGGAPPHLWGITSDIVVTADGDLSAEELRRLAESLRR